jgi:hypothetical protein
MSDNAFNKFRAAVEVLQRGRSSMVENIAEEILVQGDDLTDNPFLFNEFVESQGTRLHFLTMLMGQLEFLADQFDEQACEQAATESHTFANYEESFHQEPPAPKKRRRKAKNVSQTTPKEELPEELG